MLFPKPEGEKTDSVKEEIVISDGISKLIWKKFIFYKYEFNRINHL